MNKYVFFTLLGVLMFFGACKLNTAITYESKDFNQFKKNNYEFAQRRTVDDNLVFAYFVKRSDYVNDWYVVGIEFYNRTGEVPRIQVSNFMVKDENDKIIFTAADVVWDKSNLYKRDDDLKSSEGYYCYFQGFKQNINTENIKELTYYVSCTLNGIKFKDTLIRIEEKWVSPLV